MNSKGTLNIEILLSLIIFIILSVFLMSITINELTSLDETQNRKESRILTNDIGEIITNVYQNGQGYSTKYKLPNTINKETYILKINNTGVFVNSHYQLTYTKILPNILKEKQYFLESGNVYEFTNINGTIDIIKNN